ncbi:hypothetical protein T08_11625 [Trichinella sp. T8]|nr:hypothetical protein T08_11625 [Trichinella sp. T8]
MKINIYPEFGDLLLFTPNSITRECSSPWSRLRPKPEGRTESVAHGADWITMPRRCRVPLSSDRIRMRRSCMGNAKILTIHRGTSFVAITDSQMVPIANDYLLDRQDNVRLLRFHFKMLLYAFTAKWIPLKENTDANAPSR